MYESQMRELARRVIAVHGKLIEVIFTGKWPEGTSHLVFSDGTILPASEISSMLTFGYLGTGPGCYAAFLSAAGFKQTDVTDVKEPLKLKSDGSRVRSTGRRRTRGTVVVSAPSAEEARSKIEKPPFADSCILSEEILCNGKPVEEKFTVEATSEWRHLTKEMEQAKAQKMVKQRIPSGSKILELYVQDKPTSIKEQSVTVNTASENQARKTAMKKLPPSSEIVEIHMQDKSTIERVDVEAFDQNEALHKAHARVGWPTGWRITCKRQPSKGFLSIRKKPGKYEFQYPIAQKEVRIRYQIPEKEVQIKYRPPARIRVNYGPKKLKCTECGSVMDTTTEGVFYVGGPPAPESAIVKLRCERCNITRFEKRWEIEGEWIEWEDGSKTPL
ncbi:MAG: hypothetical protein ACE5OW_05385 [Candidatus Bathyarchaeia archaeon]